jgi:hypothetical protein
MMLIQDSNENDESVVFNAVQYDNWLTKQEAMQCEDLQAFN